MHHMHICPGTSLICKVHDAVVSLSAGQDASMRPAISKIVIKFINSRMPIQPFPAQISDNVRIFQNTKPLPMIDEEKVLQSINMVEKY